MKDLAKLKDDLQRRGIVKVVHMHADHFEPETWVQSDQYNMSLLNRYLEQMGPLTMSVFFAPSFVVRLRSDKPDPTSEYDLGGSQDDRVVFCRFSRSARVQEVLWCLENTGVDIHLHMHHELWTRNDCQGDRLVPRPQKKLTDDQKRLRSWIMTHSNCTMDSARVRRALMLYRVWLEAVLNRPLGPWAFVHGCWALAASDFTACTIRDELSILRANGCVADFSFPAGRRHCDPVIKEPTVVDPTTVGPKAYDLPGADAQTLSSGAKWTWARMLIWNSGRSAWWPSLDFKSQRVVEALNTGNILAYITLDAPVIDGVAYVKTHAHSMDPAYWTASKAVSPLANAWPHFARAQSILESLQVPFVSQPISQFISDFREPDPQPPAVQNAERPGEGQSVVAKDDPPVHPDAG